MRAVRRTDLLALVLVGALCLAAIGAGAAALEYETQVVELGGESREVRVPRGYVFEVVTAAIDRPRMPAFADNGDLFIGSKGTSIFRLEPPYTDARVLVKLDDFPHSVEVREGEMLFGRTHGLYRAPYRPGQARIEPSAVTLLARLPGEGPHHMTRTVRVGPDGRVYVSLGQTGNCGDNYLDESYPFESRRGGYFVLREDTTPPRLEPFATGLRNPVGFDWHPSTKVLYSTNNGPDHWGFDLPREYFARVTPGSFHGMPWFQFDGEKLRRDDCVKSDPPRPKSDVSIPAVTFAAHQAPVGLAFVPDGFGAGLSGDAIVALHGSWVVGEGAVAAAARRHPKLVIVRFENGEANRVEDLVTGFQVESGKRWARPVGLAFGPDGALYITSDRKPGALFRLRRTGPPSESGE